MSASRGVLSCALLVLLTPLGAAYGTLDVAGNEGDGVRDRVDGTLVFALYGFYGLPATAGHHYKIGWADENRTMFVYRDSDADYEADPGETMTPTVTAQTHGNATDHVLVILPNGLRAQICLGDATDGLDGLARGVRCGGDVDRDGDGDVQELLQLRLPVMAGPDDGLRPHLPLLP